MKGFLKAPNEAQARAAPCPKTDKSYLALLQQWRARWTDALEDGALSTEEQRVLMALAAARPAQASDRAYVAWAALYDTQLEGVAKGAIVDNRVEQESYEVTPQEAQMLEVIEAMRPSVRGGAAWARWFELYIKFEGRIFGSIEYLSTQTLNDRHRNWLTRLEVCCSTDLPDGAVLRGDSRHLFKVRISSSSLHHRSPGPSPSTAGEANDPLCFDQSYPCLECGTS